MLETAFVAIDPGSSSGAIAVWYPECAPALDVENMPSTYLDILTFLRTISERGNVYAIMENVGGTRPGNAAKSARTFAEHCGALKMALLAAGISHELVMPRKWLTGLFGESYPKGGAAPEVKARKHYIYAKMQCLYPQVKFTLRQADAVAILHWAKVTKGAV